MKNVKILTVVTAVILLVTIVAIAGEALQFRDPITTIGDLRFNPTAQEFNFLRSTTEVSIAGMDLKGQLFIPTGSGFRARFSAPVGGLTFAVTAYFGSLAFDPPVEDPFYSTELTIDIDFVTGFEDITVTVPKFPLGIPGVAPDQPVKAHPAPSQPLKVFPAFFNWRVVKNEPVVNYPVLAAARVIDGDTFEFWVHIAPRSAYFVNVRLADVDTPEIRGECKEEGFRVKRLVEKFLQNAEAITITRTGKVSFDRWVCVVTVDGKDLGEWLQDNRLTKADLCP